MKHETELINFKQWVENHNPEENWDWDDPEKIERLLNVSDQTRAEVGVADMTDALRRVVCTRFVRPVAAVDSE